MWSANSGDNSKEGKNENVSISETSNNQNIEITLTADDNKSSTSVPDGRQLSSSNISSSGSSSHSTCSGGATKTCEVGNNDDCHSAIDSGFLSGPQLLLDDAEAAELLVDSAISISATNVEEKKLQNIAAVAVADAADDTDYLDSGCIEEEIVAETTATNDQMILERGVDTGLTEWFCNLSLKNSNQPLNNLGSTATATTTTTSARKSSTKDSSNQSKQNSWEIYYQQNNDGDTQLHLACIMGYVDVVAALIRMAPHPCLFNIQNDEAQTGLHLAVLTGQPRIVRMLLLAGAEPVVRDRNGNTALHLASVAGDLQCVKALTIPISASEMQEAHRMYGHWSMDKTTSYLRCAQLPSDLEIRNFEGERCVHLAAQGGHIEVLRHLVWFGADINAREGKSGRTPLHIAIECCNEILANFLLEECSKLNLETATYAGLTAYQVACILNNSQMQNNLEKRGAEPLTPPDSDIDSDSELDLDDTQIYDRFGDPGFFLNYGGKTINVA